VVLASTTLRQRWKPKKRPFTFIKDLIITNEIIPSWNE